MGDVATVTAESAAEILPGIHRGMPFETYAALDALNNSFLSDVESHSPHHAHYWKTHKEQDTKALATGRALHTLVLEPEIFEAIYTAEPDFGDCRKKENKEARDAWRADNAGKTLIGAGDLAACRGMAASVRAHPVARMLVHSKQAGTENEVVAVWVHPTTGLRCKARADMLRPSWDAIVDLKTTRSAKPSEFIKSVWDYGYHRQAAWYLDGFKAGGLPAFTEFVFVAVEKEPPYAVCVMRLQKDAIEIGREQLRKLVDEVAACKRTGDWIGYSVGLEDVSVPAFRAREFYKQAGF